MHQKRVYTKSNPLKNANDADNPVEYKDMSRVAEAMEYVTQRLCSYGWDAAVNPKRFTRTDKPTPSVFAHYLRQFQKLRDTLTVFITTPTVPGVTAERDWMTVQEANDIEQILVDIDRLLHSMAAAFRHCRIVFIKYIGSGEAEN